MNPVFCADLRFTPTLSRGTSMFYLLRLHSGILCIGSALDRNIASTNTPTVALA